MFAHHMYANDLLLFSCQNQLDKSGRSALSLGAINICPREGDHTYLLILLFGFYSSETNTRCFWISEGAPRHNLVVNLFFAYWKQGITNGDASLISCYVSKKILADDITDGKDMGGRCLKMFIDLNPFCIKNDSRCFQVQAFNIGLAARCNQNLIRLIYRKLVVVSSCNYFLVPTPSYLEHVCTGSDSNTFRLENAGYGC